MAEQNHSIHVLLGVCGSVAAFKAQELCRQLIHRGAEVQVVLTHGACEFVTPLSFQALSGNPVKTDLFDLHGENQFGHIELARWADVVLIAPATADLIAKAALGLANDFLSTLLLATKAPLVFAPAMNVSMWGHPATQGHIETLASRGARFIAPASGTLACGEEGQGKLADWPDILEAIFVPPEPAKPLHQQKVLITAGPTVEPIDPVRYISNRSSGKMGFALAQAAADLGASVTLVSGPVQLATPPGVQRIDVQTAEEMRAAVLKEFPGSVLTVKCAAVGDFRVVNQQNEKLKKSESLTLELEKNPDILAELGSIKKEWQVLVGFAAETQNLAEQVRLKRDRKKADWIIGNDVSNKEFGFDSELNQVLISDGQNEFTLGPVSKKQLAVEIFKQLLFDPHLGPKLTR